MASMDFDWGKVVSGLGSVLGTGLSFIPGIGPILGSAVSGLGSTFGGALSDDYKHDQQLDAEQRAKEEFDRQTAMQNDEYDRRVADERAYNDPTAQAERLKQAGINPLSSMTTGGAVASQTAGNTTGSSQNVPIQSPQFGMSDVISHMSNILNIQKRAKEIDKLDVDTVIANWDVELKKQLKSYNEENYPILLEASKQRVANSRQELQNMIAKEDYDKTAVAELRARIAKEEAETALIELQKVGQSTNNLISENRLEQIRQEIETGKFIQDYHKWLSQKEKYLFEIAKVDKEIKDYEFGVIYDSGLFEEKTESEVKRIKGLADDIGFENTLRNTLKSLAEDPDGFNFEDNYGIILLYLIEKLA